MPFSWWVDFYYPGLHESKNPESSPELFLEPIWTLSFWYWLLHVSNHVDSPEPWGPRPVGVPGPPFFPMPLPPCGATALEVLPGSCKASPEAGPPWFWPLPLPGHPRWYGQSDCAHLDPGPWHGISMLLWQHQLGPKPSALQDKTSHRDSSDPWVTDRRRKRKEQNKILETVRWEGGKTRIEILKEFYIKIKLKKKLSSLSLTPGSWAASKPGRSFVNVQDMELNKSLSVPHFGGWSLRRLYLRGNDLGCLEGGDLEKVLLGYGRGCFWWLFRKT